MGWWWGQGSRCTEDTETRVPRCGRDRLGEVIFAGPWQRPLHGLTPVTHSGEGAKANEGVSKELCEGPTGCFNLLFD